MARGSKQIARSTQAADPAATDAARHFSKITPPTLQRVSANARLFERLDGALRHRVVWIHAPPGAGKTTLVASYLFARGVTPLWYRMDEGDADPATVFFYLAAVAARSDAAKPLPLLTPELQRVLPLFARRFFRELFAPRAACLVFDDYHEIAADAPLHDCLPQGLEEVPDGSHVIIVSRTPPPPQLARLRLNGCVDVVEPEALRLTATEAAGLAGARGTQASRDSIERIAALTQGWAAGVVLMLEAGDADAPPSARRETPVPELLFDYFAGEILRRMPAAARRVVAILAFMPTMTAATAERLTGSSEAPAILEDLRKRNYFTVRDTGAEPHYRFHPLFRDFLLQTARALMTPDEANALRITAAALLDEGEDADSAAGLLAEAGAFEDLAGLVRRRASTLLDEGRFRTLGKWLATIPVTLVESDGWLAYFSGESRLWSEPEAALPHYAMAFDCFVRTGDVTGQYLAWAGQADSIRLSPFGDQARFDPLFVILRDMLARHPDLPTGRVMERVAIVTAIGFSRRGDDRQGIELWQRRALDAARETGRPGGLELAASMFAVTDLHDANYARAMQNLQAIPDPFAISHLRVAYVSAIVAHGMTLLYRRKTGDCMKFVETAVEKIDAAGWGLWTHLLAGLAVNDAYQRGDVAASGHWLPRMAGYAGRVVSHRGAHYQVAAAQHHLLTGDLVAARSHADDAVTIAEASGWNFFEALARAIRTEVLLEARSLDAAQDELVRLDALLARSATRDAAPRAEFLRADLLFARGEEAAGTNALRAALTLGRRLDGRRVSLAAPRTARLLARALRANIEPDYARELIRLSSLPSPDPFDELWAWPIRITTLGRFSIAVGGVPLAFSRKTPKRLIALVKAIATYGGRAVPEQKLIDAVWPDEEGDAARSALTVALHRLRKMLGDAEAIVVSGGTIGFDPRRCWLDLWTFEHLLPLGADLSGAAVPRCERLFALYKGDFLAGDEGVPWTWPRREQMRARFARMVEVRATMKGGVDAVAIFDRGLEAAPEAEGLYQGLMRHHLAAGRPGEGLSVYARLRRKLDESDGALPGAASESLRERLRAG